MSKTFSSFSFQIFLYFDKYIMWIIHLIFNRIWGPDHDFTLEEILNELTFFRGESYHAIRECGEDIEVDCITMNFTDLVGMIRSSCDDVFSQCRWTTAINSESFDCCTYFLPIQTEVGLCYALNSIHSEAWVENEKKNKMKWKIVYFASIKIKIV